MVPLLFSEPPSPPRDVMAEGLSPHSINITFLQPIIWNTMIDIMYKVTFHPVEDSVNLSFFKFAATVKFQSPGREKRLLEGLLVGTEYVIIVTAINEFGSSLPSNPVQAWTNDFTREATIFARFYSGVNACTRHNIVSTADEAGALLLANGTDILYYQVNDITVANTFNPILPTKRFLHTFPATVRGSCVCVCLSSILSCECVNSFST